MGNCVSWQEKFMFKVNLIADKKTGMLNSFRLRLSVRQEVENRVTKLGIVEIDLAEYTASPSQVWHLLHAVVVFS